MKSCGIVIPTGNGRFVMVRIMGGCVYVRQTKLQETASGEKVWSAMNEPDIPFLAQAPFFGQHISDGPFVSGLQQLEPDSEPAG